MTGIKKVEPCHGCGEMVTYIKCKNRHTVTVDTEPVHIRLTKKTEIIWGEEIRPREFITIDGGIVYGVIVGDAYDDDDPDTNLIQCFEPHKWKCPNGGRKRRRVYG